MLIIIYSLSYVIIQTSRRNTRYAVIEMTYESSTHLFFKYPGLICLKGRTKKKEEKNGDHICLYTISISFTRDRFSTFFLLLIYSKYYFHTKYVN